MMDIYTSGTHTRTLPLTPFNLSTSGAAAYLDGAGYNGNLMGSIEWDKGSGGASHYTFLRPNQSANDTFALFTATSQDAATGQVLGFDWNQSSNTFTFPGTVNAQTALKLNGTNVVSNTATTWTGDQTVNGSVKLILGHSSGASGGSAYWASDGNASSRIWQMRNDEAAEGDFVFKRSTDNSSAPSLNVLALTTPTPSRTDATWTGTWTVSGDARATGKTLDSAGSAGSSGQIFKSTGTGTQWGTASAPIALHRSTDHDYATGGVYQADDTVTVAIAANAILHLEGVLFVSGDGAVQLNGPSGCTGKVNWIGDGNVGTIRNNLGDDLTLTTVTVIHFSAIVKNGSTAGNIAIFGRNADADVTIQALSGMTVIPE